VKRSGDITAAAVILFCGSGFLALFLLFGILGASLVQVPPAARFGQMIGLSFYAAFAAWGIATGIGILRLHPWARISMIVMSALAIFCCVCGSIGLMVVPMILRQTPDVPPAFATIVVFSGVVTLLIPLAIAIWWLILFTRKRVITEFANRSAVTPGMAGAPFDASTSMSGAPQFAAAPSATQIPVSIRVIAVLYLVFGAFALCAAPFSIRLKMPAMLLGKVVEGWPGWTFMVLFALVQTVLCIAVLKKKAWSLDGFIAVQIFGVVNGALFAITPSRSVYWDRVIQAESLPPNVNAAVMESMMKTLIPISLSLGVVLWAVCLYFLVTRRKAFRAVCAPRPERAQ
jgi:hypothetical protein